MLVERKQNHEIDPSHLKLLIFRSAVVKIKEFKGAFRKTKAFLM